MGRRSLAERTAIVTGASGGLGRAIALALAERRARLILTARSVDKLNMTARDATARGARATIVPGDLSEAATRDEVLDAARRRDEPLDVLVNNAGVSALGRFSEADADRLARIMRLNFTAAAELTRGAIPLLRESDDPAVVNVGSILGVHGAPLNSEYCASKGALRLWSQALRAELSRDGIDVMLVSPGTIDTGFFDHLIEKRREPSWTKRRGVSPEFVAERLVRGLERRSREVVPGLTAKAFVGVARLAPWLLDRIMRRYG